MKSRLVILLSTILGAVILLTASRATALQSSCTNRATFLDVVGTPNGTVLDTKETFTKIWRYRNDGTCIWNRNYRMVKMSGTKFGGQTVVRFPRTVRRGELVDLAVVMRAPDKPGRYLSDWEMQTPDGTAMSIPRVDIYVDLRHDASPGLAVAGFGLTTSCGEPELIKNTISPLDGKVQAGQTFKKIWGFRNNSGCRWNEEFRLFNVSSQRFGGPRVIWFPDNFSGNEVELSAYFAAPSDIGGYSNRWQLQDKKGNVLRELTMNFTVVPPPTKVPPTPVPPTKVPPTPEPVSACTDKYRFIKDVTIPDGSVLEPGEIFTKIWRYRNTGTCTWDERYRVGYYSGRTMGSPSWFRLPYDVQPEKTVDIAVSLVAPTQPGYYKTRWQLHAPDGDAFPISSRPFLEIYVEE